MNFVIRVKRAAGPAAPAVWQEFAYEGHDSDSVAAALRELNARTPLTDLEGREAPPVRWECGCACGKCGACAMRVNGLPTLACRAICPAGIHADELISRSNAEIGRASCRESG